MRPVTWASMSSWRPTVARSSTALAMAGGFVGDRFLRSRRGRRDVIAGRGRRRSRLRRCAPCYRSGARWRRGSRRSRPGGLVSTGAIPMRWPPSGTSCACASCARARGQRRRWRCRAFAACRSTTRRRIADRVGDRGRVAVRAQAAAAVGQPRRDARRRSADLLPSASNGCAACCARPALLEMDPIASRQILVESFVPGPEVALEGLLSGGRAPPVGALRQAGSARRTVLRGDDLRDAVAPARRDAGGDRGGGRGRARAVGLGSGPVHAELRLGAAGGRW